MRVQGNNEGAMLGDIHQGLDPWKNTQRMHTLFSVDEFIDDMQVGVD